MSSDMVVYPSNLNSRTMRSVSKYVVMIECFVGQVLVTITPTRYGAHSIDKQFTIVGPC